jgi:N-acetylglucosamine-6-phosphate deacetylase
VSRLLAGTLARGGSPAEGWIEIDRDRISETGTGAPPRRPDERCLGILAPGLCDLQVNGASGQAVTGGPGALDAIDAVQLACGVTSYLPTLVSPDDLTAQRVLPELAERAADPASPVAGAHIEGPFLNPSHAGMHPLESLRSPADGVPAWLESPAVRLVTLAPELPGALNLIRRLTARGVVVSLGHSGADAATAADAVEAGATMVTHVFNAMAPLHHRAPALPGMALVDARVRVTVIADGVHVDPIVLELVRRTAGDRCVLITDATPAAAGPPGRYEMAGVPIETAPGGAARTLDGRLAGSTLTLDAAVRGWESMTEATLAEALHAAGEAPAAAIGLPSALTPGAPADLVVLSPEGRVKRVMRRGRWLAGADTVA